MTFLPSIVIISLYFAKRRALATGIVSTGGGIGAFICAPLSRYLMDSYGWRGATWILAGFILQGVVAGALFRPPSVDISKEVAVSQNQIKNQASVTEDVTAIKVTLKNDSKREITLDKQSPVHGENEVKSATAGEQRKTNEIPMEKKEDKLSILDEVKAMLKFIKNPLFLIFSLSACLYRAGKSILNSCPQII